MTEAPGASAGPWRTVSLPWGAWYQDTEHQLLVPATWRLDRLEPRDAGPWSRRQVADALDQSVESDGLIRLARGRQRVCIAVDDLARPTPVAEILPVVLRQLHGAGLERSHISIVVAAGTHGQMTDEQLGWKLGAEIVATYRVERHDASGSLSPTGTRLGPHELRINRTFHQADLRVGIGSTLPHAFAAYSGGAKLLLPGLASVEATSRTHKFHQLGFRGGFDSATNRFRAEAEDLARRLGFRYGISAVTDTRRRIVALAAGDLVAAHRAATRVAASAYRTDVRRTYDCLILNAYPKDLDLVQSESALFALKTVPAAVVREGGLLVLATAASEGVGRHGLFAPGGVSYRPPGVRRALGDRELWLYCPGLPEVEARRLHWVGYPFFNDRTRLAEALAGRLARHSRAGVLPCAPQQLLHDLRPPTRADPAP